MTRTLSLAALIAFAQPIGAAASGMALRGESTTIMRAIKDEMKRTLSRLKMDNLKKPYFVRYQVKDWRRFEVVGSFGALRHTEDYRNRFLKVELRIGGRKFDNSHYVGRDQYRFRPFTNQMVLENDYDALRFSMWKTSDRAYKYALEKLSQKKAYKASRMIKEMFPDLSKDPVASSEEELTSPHFDKPFWEDRIRRLSAIFRDYPALRTSRVALYGIHAHKYSADSEGRRFIRPEHDIEIYISATAKAEDGHALSERRRFIRHSLDDLPSFEELAAEVEELAKNLSIQVKAKTLEEYIGPVLLEGQAAGEFFNQLLARNISFPRSLWLENEGAKKQFHTGSLVSRKGLRVVSPLISAFDDPSAVEFEGIPLIGHYRVDDEGIPAQRLDLIEKGILKDVPMSRAPVKDRNLSNGHGRGGLDEYETAHIGNLFITASKTLEAGALKDSLLERAREFGLDFGIIIRRIEGEGRRKPDDLLAAPVAVYKAYVDGGKEEPVRNVRFSAVTLRALRDIVAASKKRRVHNFYQLGPYSSSGGETQASIVHPDVLIAEMELKETDRKPKKLPYLKRPSFPRRLKR